MLLAKTLAANSFCPMEFLQMCSYAPRQYSQSDWLCVIMSYIAHTLIKNPQHPFPCIFFELSPIHAGYVLKILCHNELFLLSGLDQLLLIILWLNTVIGLLARGWFEVDLEVGKSCVFGERVYIIFKQRRTTNSFFF